jgi:hypothetical protein
LKINQIISVFLTAAFFMACSDRPSSVLSEKKMEKVLYDLYIADAEISTNYAVFSSDSVHRQELLNAVLKKHKVKEAVFDSSLVWYNSNLDKFLKINENVGKRYTHTLDALRPKPVTSEMKDENKFYLPVKEKHFFLTVKDLPQKVYAFKADTILSDYGSSYTLQFEALGITPEIHPIVTFQLKGVDTTYIQRDTISRNGLFTTSIPTRQKQVKELQGSIYFPEIPNNMSIFIYNFELTRKPSDLKEIK